MIKYFPLMKIPNPRILPLSNAGVFVLVPISLFLASYSLPYRTMGNQHSLFFTQAADTVETSLLIRAQYDAVTQMTLFFANESVKGISVRTDTERNRLTKGYYEINGERVRYPADPIQLKKFYNKKTITVRFRGDTLGHRNVYRQSITGVRLFTELKLSDTILSNNEPLGISWNPNGNRKEKLRIRVHCNDANVQRETRQSSTWDTLVADNGQFTIPASVIAGLAAKGSYAIVLSRGSLLTQGHRKVGNMISILAEAAIRFTKEH
jgi:hypothetical protein